MTTETSLTAPARARHNAPSLREAVVPTATMAALNVKYFEGNYLLYRKDGAGMKRACRGNPRFRHPSRQSAEAEAARLLVMLPESTFIILQEVGRVKLRPDPDAVTGCADDQAFAAVPTETLRKIADHG